MKNAIIAAIGTVGSVIAAALGGWDSAIITLIVFMAVDFIMGVVLALVFKHSSKTTTGGYSSAIGWKGLAKKCATLMLVVVANRLDMQIGANFIRDGVCIAFMANEAMSIVENASLMGVPIPAIVTKALDVLHNQTEQAFQQGQSSKQEQDK